MEIEEFALGDSFIHRLDPRVKIFAAVFLSIVITLSTHILPVAEALALVICLILISPISITRVFRRLALVNVFVLFLWLFLPFTYPGEIIYSLGPLGITREGILFALLISLKTNTIMMMLLLLLGTSPVFNLVHALSHMGVPDKLVHLFFFCYRYIHVIHEEYHRLITAMKMRSFKPGTNLRTYRAYAYLVGMLLVRSFDRSGRIYAAMKCRGFKGRFYIIHHYEMKKCDYMVAASSAVLCAIFLVVR
jgi:cobalt/nickel transport system permease protein